MAAPELQQGTLDLLILKTLQLGALHGWAISRRIHQQSGEVLTVGQGSLYPALYRLEERGLIRAEWGISDEGRRAKFYTLSAAGKKALAREMAAWRTYSGAVNLVLAGA
jgi:PadR family transcriptional regulator, regulatory protein PadR